VEILHILLHLATIITGEPPLCDYDFACRLYCLHLLLFSLFPWIGFQEWS